MVFILYYILLMCFALIYYFMKIQKKNTELTCFCIIFSKGASCQLKLTGMEFTKVSKCFVEKHDNSS